MYGAQLIDETPRRGAHGKIAFIHPKGAHGVLIELLEPDEGEEQSDRRQRQEAPHVAQAVTALHCEGDEECEPYQ